MKRHLLPLQSAAIPVILQAAAQVQPASVSEINKGFRKSALFPVITSGEQYSIHAFHKPGTGTNHPSLSWRDPGGF